MRREKDCIIPRFDRINAEICLDEPLRIFGDDIAAPVYLPVKSHRDGFIIPEKEYIRAPELTGDKIIIVGSSLGMGVLKAANGNIIINDVRQDDPQIFVAIHPTVGLMMLWAAYVKILDDVPFSKSLRSSVGLKL